MRKLPLSLLAVSTFAVAYAAGVYSGSLVARRRARRPGGSSESSPEHGCVDEALTHYELAANWARQAMFGSG